MSPTFGPTSILVAADTTATLLASNAAIKLASAAVLITSPMGTFLCQRPMVMRVFFMAGPARFALRIGASAINSDDAACGTL
jgi:hypothetical protein